LTPQSINEIGGYKIQGKKNREARQLISDAKALAKAGVFAIVLECVPAMLGRAITKAVKVPIIGIGAGKYCDGQVLVTHDLLGLYAELTPKFAKRYADLGSAMKKAFASYKREVEEGAFPDADHSF